MRLVTVDVWRLAVKRKRGIERRGFIETRV